MVRYKIEQCNQNCCVLQSQYSCINKNGFLTNISGNAMKIITGFLTNISGNAMKIIAFRRLFFVRSNILHYTRIYFCELAILNFFSEVLFSRIRLKFAK